MNAPKGIALVLGTRPEMVKLAGLAHLLGKDARIIHTGQHYDSNLSESVWEAMNLPAPEVVLSVGNTSRANQIGSALNELDEIFRNDPPEVVVVQGDTNATLAGAIAANTHSIPLVHVEAGLRSFDRAMPEEHNRVMVDHIADALCVPTGVNLINLEQEGIDAQRISVTGNTVVEAVMSQMLPEQQRHDLLAQLGLVDKEYVLATIHRPENTDDLENLRIILEELGKVTSTVVLPLHPRTKARIISAGLDTLLEPLHVIDPVTPPDFLAMALHSAVLVSDSGGIQEECSVLKRPLLVVRRSTERPEVVGTFATRTTPGPAISVIVNEWLGNIHTVHAELEKLPSPYGDGQASQRILSIIEGLRPVSAKAA